MQILSDSCRLFQILPDFSRFFEILTGFLRFLQITSESLKLPQIPSDSFKCIQVLSFFSDSLFQIFSIFFNRSDYAECFSILPVCFQSNFLRFYQRPSGILKILSKFSVLFRSFQILSDFSKFLKFSI